MKNSEVVLKILRISLIIIVLGFFMQRVTAQAKKETSVIKKTCVERRTSKDDENGKVVKTDTANEVSDGMIPSPKSPAQQISKEENVYIVKNDTFNAVKRKVINVEKKKKPDIDRNE